MKLILGEPQTWLMISQEVEKVYHKVLFFLKRDADADADMLKDVDQCKHSYWNTIGAPLLTWINFNTSMDI